MVRNLIDNKTIISENETVSKRQLKTFKLHLSNKLKLLISHSCNRDKTNTLPFLDIKHVLSNKK